ncbi:pyridoxal phosphate-dependent aminotransferase [Actinomadura monticuli]|uniref:Pyridoxal phosphate-dependent aminotransferase n=1 Tax=Actinomadura monticuli TaxID=3097367 RepID=A0ABV4Q4W2_9ACTN
MDDRLREVAERAADPRDPIELRDLYIGRIEAELGTAAVHGQALARWRASRRRRTVDPVDLLSEPVFIRFVKELFNFYFRDDLYGRLRHDGTVILSSGAADETCYGLPTALKDCVRQALDRDWYGYSDSRGRLAVREAIAAYHNARTENAVYTADRVCVVQGGTSAINAVVDFLALNRAASLARPTAAALCGIPNYPPLVEAVSRRFPTRLVPLAAADGRTDLSGLIEAITPDVPLVLLQSVTNPTGTAVSEDDLARLLAAAGPATTIILDECHECLGPVEPHGQARTDPRVIRVLSISKPFSAPGLKVGWILASASFVEDFYEYSSTTHGGPASLFYLLVETLARFERWTCEGVDEPGTEQMAEWDPAYGLDHASVAVAYREYRAERVARERSLTGLRDDAYARLRDAGLNVVLPGYSFNLAVSADHWPDGYLYFRQLLARHGVSFLPGILTYALGGSWVRITTARPAHDVETGIRLLTSLAG